MHMDFYEKLLLLKAKRKLKYKDIGSLVDMSDSTIRMAINRKSLSELEKKEIADFFDLENNQIKEPGPHYKKSEKFNLRTLKEAALFAAENFTEMMDIEPLFKIVVENYSKEKIIDFAEKHIGDKK